MTTSSPDPPVSLMSPAMFEMLTRPSRPTFTFRENFSVSSGPLFRVRP
jgi:hypothetical protein